MTKRRTKGFLRRRLAKGLKNLRGEVSQHRFKQVAGIDDTSINRIENRQQNVTIDTLEILCIHLDCDLEDLFPKDL